MDPVLVDQAMNPRTKVILPVHFGGLACNMAAILAIAEKQGVAVVEDAAHATGTRYRITEPSVSEVRRLAKRDTVSHRTAARGRRVARVIKAKQMPGLFP